MSEELLQKALEALKPFANYACSPVERCDCHNCRARTVVAALEVALMKPREEDRPSMSMFASAADYNAAMDKWLTPTPPSVRRTT